MKRLMSLFFLFLLAGNTGFAQQALQLKNEADSLKDSHRYDQAIERYYQAMTLSEKQGNDSLMGVISFKIGYVYSKMEQHEQALLHYREGIRIHQKNNQSGNLAAGYTMLGGAYRKLGKLDSALLMQRLAVHESSVAKDTQLLAKSLNNLGVAFRNQNQLDSANHYYQYSRRFYRALSDTAGLISLGINQGRLHVLMHHHERGMKLLHEAYQLARQKDDLPMQRRALANMAEAMRNQGDYRNADSLNTLHFLLDDSIKGLETRKEIARVEGSYKAIQRHAQMEILKRERGMYLIGGIASVIIILLLWFVYWQKVKGKERARLWISKQLYSRVGGDLIIAKRFLKYLEPKDSQDRESFEMVKQAIDTGIKELEELSEKALQKEGNQDK